MKTIVSFLFLFLVALSINAQEFKFEKELIDYGTISKGSDGERIFVFKNIGDKPLIIKNVQSSCGCTVPEKPEKPIMPGSKGEIKVSYDTKRVGGFSKTITIFSNAKNQVKRIRIKGIIKNSVSVENKKSKVSSAK